MAKSKADILATLRRQPVEFEGLLLKPWTAATRAAFADWRKDNPGFPGLLERLFALSVCDESAALMFAPDEAADLDGVFLERVGRRVMELNGLMEDSDPKVPSTETTN